VLTVEYGDRISEDPRIRVVKPWDFKKMGRRFEVAFSFSSFEHDGLGRYGDPLDGEADLKMMAFMRDHVVEPVRACRTAARPDAGSSLTVRFPCPCLDAPVLLVRLPRTPRMMMMLLQGGLFFVAVPMGPDRVFYNMHRQYGPVRWALMTAGWTVVDVEPKGFVGPGFGGQNPFLLTPTANASRPAAL